MSTEFYVGDIGIKLRRQLKYQHPDDAEGTYRVYDTTGATVTLNFYKPDGTILVKTATLETPAADGYIYYAWLAGDLDIAGPWTCLLVAAKTGETRHATIPFTVRAK